MHVKLRVNPRRPRRKAKYSLATDSEQVPRGKGEKNRCERSEIVPEIMCLQGVRAGSTDSFLDAERERIHEKPEKPERKAEAKRGGERRRAPPPLLFRSSPLSCLSCLSWTKKSFFRAFMEGSVDPVMACLLLNESASYCPWQA